MSRSGGRASFMLGITTLVLLLETRMSASEGECAKMPYSGCVKVINTASPHLSRDLRAKCC
jgi:hypothetical protein